MLTPVSNFMQSKEAVRYYPSPALQVEIEVNKMQIIMNSDVPAIKLGTAYGFQLVPEIDGQAVTTGVAKFYLKKYKQDSTKLIEKEVECADSKFTFAWTADDISVLDSGEYFFYIVYKGEGATDWLAMSKPGACIDVYSFY